MDKQDFNNAEFFDVDPELFRKAVSRENRNPVRPDENAGETARTLPAEEENIPLPEENAGLPEEETTIPERAGEELCASPEPEVSAAIEEEPLLSEEKTEERGKKKKKKGKDTENRKPPIEEQYLTDENGARKRFHSWKVSNTMSNIFLVVSAGIFLVCAIELGAYFYSSYEYAKSMSDLENGMGGGIENEDALKELLSDPTNGDVHVFPDEEAYEVVAAVSHDNTISDTWKAQYEYLSSANSDCIGYISIPDTVLSYPVMFTPSDYTYYLYRNFSGEYEYRGSLFLDYQTKIGQSQNIIIYGHNMTDGLMFGTLREYLDKDYYENHKYVYFNTAVSEGIYEVMAVVKTKIYTVEDTCFKYYRYGGVLTKDEFETYVREMVSMSEYSTGVEAQWGDELISLSTCNRYTDEGRLVIVCRRIN